METKNGFTLVELLIVISIIAILVTIVLIAINPRTVIRNTNDTKKRTEINQLKTALQLYFNDNNSYPASVNDLVPTYTRSLPNWWSTDGRYAESGTDYAAGVNLENPSSAGNDSNTATICGSSITATSLDTTGLDYFICPD